VADFLAFVGLFVGLFVVFVTEGSCLFGDNNSSSDSSPFSTFFGTEGRTSSERLVVDTSLGTLSPRVVLTSLASLIEEFDDVEFNSDLFENLICV
jgi:hypothetical protein